MRILLAAKTMGVGGLERIVVALARELHGRGHQVWVVSSGGGLVDDLRRAGAQHIVAPLEITSPIGVLHAARQIRRAVLEHHIDLVHSFSATASVAINLAMRNMKTANGSDGVRVVSSPMGLQNSPRELPVTTWLRNWFLALGAEQILVISPEIRRHLKRVGARDAALVDFNFVGLDVETFQSSDDDHQSVRREFGFPADALVVTTIGALHPRKSHELFIEAAVRVAAAEPRTCFLIIGDGELRADLEALANARGLDGKLAFTGVREDIPRLLSATDVYVKPGIVEGFIGITVLEALALGKPVVAFDTEDVKLALTDGATGLIVANADVPQLAERILYLLRHPDVGQRLGQAGQQVVLERFDFGVLARRLEEFYQGVLDRPAALTP
ncbi:MAG: glycosyltransferase family 4 protein [Chloroflexi bacterium]|nr:glycosyltransferase family 4 protein [Chloroflexota bacterium]MBV9132834.1 glycosyltransferase family 4 protein [Chloroflexota bacterium]MBV9894828.1 glycosyltransferase family 4 protein [Chloroflexota bacterium]